MTENTCPPLQLDAGRPLDQEPIIRVRGLTKMFKLYEAPIDRLKESLHPFRRRYHQEFHAIKGLDFDVYRGETIGIVGRNGSGKSTLLKIITGVLTPTTGEAQVKGRVAAILELGSGFNPELSGLENVYFSGALMGFSKEEMDERVENILDFADIGDFIHQPVKTYSSGMMVRLAFSVQTSVDADIIIVDEALAVGDEAFQRKCFVRLEDLRDRGATLMYVSHAASSVVALCSHALLLNSGELILEGKPKSVVQHYHRLAHAPRERLDALLEEMKSGVFSDEDLDDAEKKTLQISAAGDPTAYYEPDLKPKSTVFYETHGAEILNPRITTPEGRQVNVLLGRDSYCFRYDVRFDEDCRDVAFGLLMKTNTGFPLCGIRSHPIRARIGNVKKGSVYEVSFRFHCDLAPGTFYFNAGVEGMHDTFDGPFVHRIFDAVMFRVQEEVDSLLTATVDFRIRPDITLVQDPDC